MIIEDRKNILPTYAPPDILFKKGKGCYLYDDKGNKYLDFVAGIAVNSFGHCNPLLVNALKNQSDNLWHLSNMFRIESSERLAKRLCEVTFADFVFFSNSGAEANECAIKMARRYHYDNGRKEKVKVIGMRNSFHGRTITTITASGNEKYTEGFLHKESLGYEQIEFNNISILKDTIKEDTAAIILEPIQGEGGITCADEKYLKEVKRICDKEDILLIFDEIQCGFGRSGDIYAYKQLGVTPDILTTAKGIGGGFPLGACLSSKKVGKCMIVGTHGSTFGGNPLATTIGNKALDILLTEGFLNSVNNAADKLKDCLESWCKDFPYIFKRATGKGLMMGVFISDNIENKKLIKDLREKENILIGKGGDNSLRLLPPLIIGDDEINQLDESIRRVIKLI